MPSTRGIETRVTCTSQSMYVGGEDKQYTHAHTNSYISSAISDYDEGCGEP